jgi:hypothetical protein
LIERLHAAERPRLHDAALHDGEDEGGESVKIAVGREAVPGVFETAANGARPTGEVGCDAAVRRQILGFDFQGEAAERTAVGTAGLDQPLAVSGQDGEDPIDGIGLRRKCGLDDDGLESFQVGVQDGEQERFLAGEEVVEAAGVGFGAVENFGDSGGGVAAFPEEVAGGFQKSFAS